MCRGLLLFLLLLISPLGVAGRDAATEEYLQRLPENTLLYISWQHLDGLDELRATNPLFRFLDSPEMKSNWQRLRDYRQRTRAQPESPSEVARQAKQRDDMPLRRLAPLVENPGFLALVIPRNSPAAHPGPPQPTHLYFYDTTGMEELLAQFEEKLAPPGQAKRTYDFEGVTLVETLGRRGSASYQARVGQWLVGGGDRKTVESWILSVQSAPHHSLKDTPAYQHAQRLRPERAQLEVFINPDPLFHMLERIPGQGGQDPPDGLQELDSSLGLSGWELFFLATAFQRDSTQYDAHAIHSSQATGLVNVIPPPVARFPSVEFAPRDASSYSVVTLSLPAIWRFLQAVLQNLPPQAAQMAAGLQGMTEGVLGISLDELVNAWGHEFAQLSYALPGRSQTSTLRLLQLHDRETILAALRALSAARGPQVNLEELPTEPDDIAVYFRFGSPEPPDEATPALEAAGKSRILYIAVAADWLIIGPSKDEIVQAMERSRQGSALSENPLFQSMRSRFPSHLSTFSFVDMEQLLSSDDAKEFLQMLTTLAAAPDREEEESDRKELEPPSLGPSTEPSPQAEGRVPVEAPPSEPPQLEIPTGYLKWWVSGTFRDQQGLHHTGYIE